MQLAADHPRHLPGTNEVGCHAGECASKVVECGV